MGEENCYGQYEVLGSALNQAAGPIYIGIGGKYMGMPTLWLRS